MTTSNQAPQPALVTGELRGYRQFQLCPDGLLPLVHASAGAWNATLELATCASGQEHAAPGAECRCGLYAWYLPGSATVSLGPASAVIAARGRCILGDRGFRAAAAHIDAVALPGLIRFNPLAASRARRMLAERYPSTRVYGSARRMLKDHPPHDVRALGIFPPRDHSRGYRSAAVALGVIVMLSTYSLAVLPREVVAATVSHWWPLLVALAVAWQAGLVWLVSKLLALQSSTPARFGASERPLDSD